MRRKLLEEIVMMHQRVITRWQDMWDATIAELKSGLEADRNLDARVTAIEEILMAKEENSVKLGFNDDADVTDDGWVPPLPPGGTVEHHGPIAGPMRVPGDDQQFISSLPKATHPADMEYQARARRLIIGRSEDEEAGAE